jgi:hypothetical protein
MGNIFLTAKSGDDNKGRGLHGGQWLKVLNFGRFLVDVIWGVRDPCNTVHYLLAWQLVTVHASVFLMDKASKSGVFYPVTILGGNFR